MLAAGLLTLAPELSQTRASLLAGAADQMSAPTNAPPIPADTVQAAFSGDLGLLAFPPLDLSLLRDPQPAFPCWVRERDPHRSGHRQRVDRPPCPRG